MKFIIIITGLVVSLSRFAYTASITIGGGSFANVFDGSGDHLSAGSQVQVGSFVGVDPSKSGADFTSLDWESFNPFLGTGSSNPDEVIGTFSAGEGFESVFQINSELDTELGDLLPPDFPVRLGFRIFDTTGISLEGVAYNTVVRDVSTWVFNDPEIITNQPPSPSIGASDDSLIFWEDSENPFQTSIEVIDDATRIEMLEVQLAAAISERDARPTQAAYDTAVALARTAGQGDVTSDPSSYSLVSLTSYNTIVAERDARPTLAAYDTAVADSRAAGQADVTTAPASYSLTTQASYDTVVAERDARFADTDGDGLTDVREIELETDPDVSTLYYLTVDPDFEASMSFSREAGREDVIQSPHVYGLTTKSLYESVVAQRDARPADSDGDGLTDAKESALGTNANEATSFYLQASYDALAAATTEEIRSKILASPQNYGLTTKTAFDNVIAQRNTRFVDTDGDGITDEKESQLASNVNERTDFYLSSSYGAAVAEAVQTGRNEVIANPQNYSLTSKSAYDGMVAQRDARPTDSDGDGLTDTVEAQLETDPNAVTIFTVNPIPLLATFGQGGQAGEALASEEPTATAVSSTIDPRVYDRDLDGITDAMEEELNTDPDDHTVFILDREHQLGLLNSRLAGRNEVISNPQNFDLATSAAYQAVMRERDIRFADSDLDGITDLKEIELATNVSEGTTFYLQGAYDLAVTDAIAKGQSLVTTNPQNFNLTQTEAYNLVVAQRDACLLERGDGVSIAEARQAGRDEVTQNPSLYSLITREAYNEVVTERDERITFGEVKDARLGSVVLLPDAENNRVKIRFSIEETDDFKVWTKRDEINEVIVPLEASKRFYRFTLEDE
ncbi:thrombospondin type 3 repeat-containing protein [Akkermansiaceae bacterium]|nr:thrombospondin type 3 repeat-containing protein [Akkermansiaceae bacterium]MDB4530080.1 thrombospondin type 3 repeat-containing protein [Akkermansiaceae bacterium]MDB4587450.1 thrombospondin type 3 repeat-containing protein [Akkermansiaceae bacterium]